MVGKQKKKGVRNKFRQVLLIEGHPEYLFKTTKAQYVTLNIGKEIFSLGSTNTRLHDHLRKIPDCEVIIEYKYKACAKGINGFRGLHIRKSGNNTTIEVSARTEEELSLEIERLKKHLESNGIPITERCSWICVDKGKKILYKDVIEEKDSNVRDRIQIIKERRLLSRGINK